MGRERKESDRESRGRDREGRNGDEKGVQYVASCVFEPNAWTD